METLFGMLGIGIFVQFGLRVLDWFGRYQDLTSLTQLWQGWIKEPTIPSWIWLMFIFMGTLLLVNNFWGIKSIWAIFFESNKRISILTAKTEASKYGWNLWGTTTANQNEAFDFINALKQAAVDGDIKFFGRKYIYDFPEAGKGQEPLIEISPKYLQQYFIDCLDFSRVSTNYNIFIKEFNKPAEKGTSYRDIYMNSGEFIKWLAKNKK